MVNTAQNTAMKLGNDLKALRQLRKQSLAAIAKPAGISAAYLQKLEKGVVKNPSPRVLMRLARVLECEYDHLMESAGYITAGKSLTGGKTSFLEAALRNEELTTEEQRAVLAFIRYLKELR
jgi:transcriptional regulator with XRE-family HTH domain